MLHQLKEDFLMGQTIVEQLLRLMLFAKLFGFNLGTSSIWQQENIWLEIGKVMIKDIGKDGENVMPIEKMDELAMDYVGTIRNVTTDMQRFKISTT